MQLNLTIHQIKSNILIYTYTVQLSLLNNTAESLDSFQILNTLDKQLRQGVYKTPWLRVH